jgi:glucan phosphorylase
MLNAATHGGVVNSSLQACFRNYNLFLDHDQNEVVPLYYERDSKGLPRPWVQVMKEAMKSVGPRFSARRMVKEYVTSFYQKALKYA